MLTKQDLNAIGSLMESKLKPVRKDISSLKSDVSSLKIDVSSLKSSVANLQTGVTQLQKGSQKLRKDLTKAINFFDKADLSTREKVNKTRSELGLQEVTFAY